MRLAWHSHRCASGASEAKIVVSLAPPTWRGVLDFRDIAPSWMPGRAGRLMFFRGRSSEDLHEYRRGTP